MSRLRAALPVLAALGCGAQTADPVKIVFQALGETTIQQRLNAVPRKLADRVTTLRSIFREVGCSGGHFNQQPVRHSSAPNLICTLPGDTDSVIVVGGHFDAVEVGMGAVDDWSGAVLLPSLYQSLKSTPRHHRFIFVGFAAEEQGLIGSAEFIDHLKRDQRRNIQAMINLECLGLGPPEVRVSRANKRLLDAFGIVAKHLNVEPRGKNLDDLTNDDSDSFLGVGIPVLTIHSITQANRRILHQPADQLRVIHMDDYYATYRLAAAYLAYLDSALD